MKKFDLDKPITFRHYLRLVVICTTPIAIVSLLVTYHAEIVDWIEEKKGEKKGDEE